MTSQPNGQMSMLGEVFELTIGSPAAGGGFVAHAPDGRVTFVRHAITGERVRAIITEEAKGYMRADAIEILEPSKLRAEPRCVHAGPGACGGCDYQHIDLGAQRRFKAERISEHLRRIAGLEIAVEVNEVPGDEHGYRWRTRVDYGVDRDGHAGFRRNRSHSIEPVGSCPIGAESIEELGITAHVWPDVSAIEVSCSSDRRKHVARFDAPVSSSLARTKGPVRGLDADIVVNGRVLRGDATLSHEVLGHHFSVRAGVFWQVHPQAATVLGQCVLEMAGDLSGANVLDLYCGAGLFTALVARTVGDDGSVIGVERSPRACEDARKNTARFPNVTIIGRDVTSRSITSASERPMTRPLSMVILDPPREGAGREVMTTLCRLTPTLERMVYVSCDPATFARDVKFARDLNWSLERLDAFDLFPMTEHVEIVGELRAVR